MREDVLDRHKDSEKIKKIIEHPVQKTDFTEMFESDELELNKVWDLFKFPPFG